MKEHYIAVLVVMYIYMLMERLKYEDLGVCLAMNGRSSQGRIQEFTKGGGGYFTIFGGAENYTLTKSKFWPK